MNLSLNLANDLETQLYNKAQDIDVAILNYILGDTEFFLDAITLYQNSNGGFGQGLYIDNYNTNSTAFTTYYALKLINLFSEDNKDRELIVKRAFTYLFHKAYQEDGMFLIAEPENNKFAHSNLFNYPSIKNIGLTMGIIGLSLLLNDSKNPYYKLALDLYNKNISLIAEFKEDEDSIIFKAILIKGLNKAGIKNELKIDNSKINVLNCLELADYIEIDSTLKERALNNLINTINSNGLWDYNKNWQNKYPEGDVAQIKWTFRQSVINYYYLKKYNFVETN